MSKDLPVGAFWWQKLLYKVNDEPHYVVIKVGGRAPTVAHTTYPEAKAEAMRLALENPGSRFIVYKAVSVSETLPPPTTVTEYVWPK